MAKTPYVNQNRDNGLTFNRSMYSNGLLMPRVIINNVMGKNKVVYIDPIQGTNADLSSQDIINKKGLVIQGESVDVIKGTGPGSIMGVLSQNQ